MFRSWNLKKIQNFNKEYENSRDYKISDDTLLGTSLKEEQMLLLCHDHHYYHHHYHQ